MNKVRIKLGGFVMKMSVQILFAVVLLGNAATMQGMIPTRATQAARRAAQTPQLRQRTDWSRDWDLRDNRDMYPIPASPGEKYAKELSDLKVVVGENPYYKGQAKQQEKEERLQKKFKELEDKIQGKVNPLTERRLQKERMKMLGQDPREYVYSYDNSNIFRVYELTKKEFDALDEDEKEKYIERLLDEEKSLGWHWEGMLDTTGPETTVSRYDLMQIKPSNQKEKRAIIKGYFKDKKEEEEERKRIVKELKRIEEKEQEKTESFWQKLVKMFSSGSKE